MSSSVALRYYLPKTVLEVAAQVRYVVVFDSVGGHLEPRVDVRVAPRVVPDRAARCSTTLEAGMLDSAALGVQLTPEGLIDAVGGQLGGYGGGGGGAGPTARTSPGVPRRTGETEAEEAADLAQRAAWTRPGSLRVAFNKTHPRTAALIADLSARAEQFLAGMRMGDGPAEVETFGSALAVVERELAAADRMRREWIAAQGVDVRSGQWQVDLGSVVLVPEPLPATLPGDTLPGDGPAGDGRAGDGPAGDGPVGDGPAGDGRVGDGPAGDGPARLLAREYGVLLAVADPERDAADTAAEGGVEGYQRVDELLLRQSRPVTIAVYRRAPAGVMAPATAAPEDSDWVLDGTLTQDLEAVDARSVLTAVGPGGHFNGDRALNVTFYPSGAVRTFGVAPTVSAAREAVRALPGGTGTGAEDGVPSRSAVAAAALEAARLQLALLQASDEFTRLAAIHAHGGELATLEQDARFATPPHGLG